MCADQLHGHWCSWKLLCNEKYCVIWYVVESYKYVNGFLNWIVAFAFDAPLTNLHNLLRIAYSYNIRCVMLSHEGIVTFKNHISYTIKECIIICKNMIKSVRTVNFVLIDYNAPDLWRLRCCSYFRLLFGNSHCCFIHDDVIKWKPFPRYSPFVRGIRRWPVNSPHKGQWHGALMFSLICAWINSWVNNREAGDAMALIMTSL